MPSRCILSKFYIKPQRGPPRTKWGCGCILSKFYIKPQLRRWSKCYYVVVSYRNSTSNHNSNLQIKVKYGVVSYRNSTSNHNSAGSPVAPGGLYLIEILHQTTTMVVAIQFRLSCILSKFYIKPQLARQWLMVPCGCILSKFYIKPQPPRWLHYID